MKKRLFWLIIIAGLMTTGAKAQVAGYLGKKFMVGANLQYSPAWGKLFYVGGRGSFLFPPPGLGFTMRCVATDEKTIKIDFITQKLLITDSYMDEDYRLYKDITARVNTMSFGITQSLFHGAPMGLYVGGGVSFAMIEAQGKSVTSNKVTSLGRFTDIGIFSEVGSTRAISDKLLIDAGLSLNWYLIGVNFVDYGASSSIDQALGINAINNLATLKVSVIYLLL